MLFAQTDTKEVRIFNIITQTSYAPKDELARVYFSLNNQSDNPLNWVKVRVIVRNPDNEIIHTFDNRKTFYHAFGEHQNRGEPLAPGLTKQVKISETVPDFCTSKGCGSVEIELLNYRLGK